MKMNKKKKKKEKNKKEEEKQNRNFRVRFPRLWEVMELWGYILH